MNKTIYEQIQMERIAQDFQWGGPEHDDNHSAWDWIAYLTKHVGRAVMWPFNSLIFRTQMVKVAALAVAAIEWLDRNYPTKGEKNETI
jgi:hypothetical protein